MDAIYRSGSTEAMERKMKLLIAIGLLAATMSTALAQGANDLPYGFVQRLPEYTALVDGLADVDPNSQDAQEIGSIILKLDELCH